MRAFFPDALEGYPHRDYRGGRLAFWTWFVLAAGLCALAMLAG